MPKRENGETELYYTILCNAMLCYTISYNTIPYYTILYYNILQYTILFINGRNGLDSHPKVSSHSASHSGGRYKYEAVVGVYDILCYVVL